MIIRKYYKRNKLICFSGMDFHGDGASSIPVIKMASNPAMVSFSDYLSGLNDKKNPIQLVTSLPQYPTGYVYLDYGAGSYLRVYDQETNDPIYQYHNVGLTGGQLMILISKAQGGKTTLASGMTTRIIEPYVDDFMYKTLMSDIVSMMGYKSLPDIGAYPFVELMDSEKTSTTDYIGQVSHYTSSMIRKFVTVTPVTTDRDVIAGVNRHISYKKANMNKIPFTMLDMFGQPIIGYPPTAIIIDSLSQLVLEDVDDPTSTLKKDKSVMDVYESATQNTSGARRAKVMGTLLSYLIDYAKKFNIIIICIGHINKMLPVNGIPVKQYRGLRAGETISGGGERAIYLASSIGRLDVIKSVGYGSSTSVDMGEDRKGFISTYSWIKCKSNSKSNTCQLVYLNGNGYDPTASLIWNMKERNILGKSGNKFYIPDYPDYKFTMKDFKEVFGDHPEMFGAAYDLATKDAAQFLDNPERAIEYGKKQLEEDRKGLREEYGDNPDARGDMMDLDDLLKMNFERDIA